MARALCFTAAMLAFAAIVALAPGWRVLWCLFPLLFSAALAVATLNVEGERPKVSFRPARPRRSEEQE